MNELENCKNQIKKQLSKIRVDILDAKYNEEKLNALYIKLFELSQFVDRCVIIDKEALKQYVSEHVENVSHQTAKKLLDVEEYVFRYTIAMNVKATGCVPIGYIKNHIAEKLIFDLENIGEKNGEND